jgi:thiamine-phosphate diphosphorylase
VLRRASEEARVELPFLVAVTDLERWSAERMVSVFQRLAERATPGMVGVQLRGPGQALRDLLALGTALGRVARENGQWLIVNDRLDLALELRAPGVHLTERSVSAAEARELCPNSRVFRACHVVSEAPGLDADAIVLSPITAQRKGRSPLGVEGIRACVYEIERAGRDTAVYALGGVQPEHVDGLRAAGAAGFLAMESVFGAVDPEAWLAVLR